MLLEEMLKEIVSNFGIQICKRASSFEGILLDYCGAKKDNYKKEIKALVNFCREGCSIELLNTQAPVDYTKNKLINMMEDNLGITRQLAEWTVSSWMYAAGFINSVQDETEKSAKLAKQTILAREINIGSYMLFGSYLNEPILWRAVDNSINGVMLVSERILCLKPFDAAESGLTGETGGNYTEDRGEHQFGSNEWASSNIREWLNSRDKTVAYSTRPPAEKAVWGGYNAYVNEAGFLINFSQKELSSIQPVYNNGVVDMVYLLTSNDLLLLNEKRKMPTRKAVQNSNYKFFELTDENYWSYWTRTPSNVSSYMVCDIIRDGSMYGYIAYRGDEGIVPSLNIKSGISVSNSGSLKNPHTIV